MHELDIRRVPKETQPANFQLPPTPQTLSEVHYHQPQFAFSEQPTQKRRFHFSFRNFVLLPFTLVVLVFGIFLGTRFINFAKSVSTTPESTFRTISTNIGAAVGSIVPGLKGLDQTKIAQDIAEKKTINILLLGYGGEGHSGTYLTDSILVVNMNFATNKVSLISIPRDVWVQIPTNGYDGSYAKINAAYAFGLDKTHYPNKLPQFADPTSGGGNLSKYVASKVVGMPIDYYAAIDFQGFKTLVDDVGGVNINVDNSFTDYTYPSSDANVDGPACSAEDGANTTCRYKIVHFDAGEQYMNGDRALEYARSRHAAGVEGSDFSRSKRQQKIIQAVEQKAFQLGMLPKIFNLMDDVAGHFQTDMTLAEIQTLAGYVNSSGTSLQNINHISLTNPGTLLVSGWSTDGQWILEPSAGLDNWNVVHEYIKANLSLQNQGKYGPFLSEAN